MRPEGLSRLGLWDNAVAKLVKKRGAESGGAGPRDWPSLEGLKRLSKVNDESLQDLRQDALACLAAALGAIDPERLVGSALRVRGRTLETPGRSFRLQGHRIHLLAVGKAAVPMARAALGKLPIASGILASNRPPTDIPKDRVRSFVGSHPLPDEGSLAAGEAALQLVDRLGRDNLLLVLVSGGASAMFEASPIPLEDLRLAYGSLLRSGLPIRDVNEVRKGLSLVKGGRLAARAAARGATVVGLIVSDIVGNPIEDIGSGPTAIESSRGARAMQVLRTHGLWEEMPPTVRTRLEAAPAEPKLEQSVRRRVHNLIVADLSLACRAAMKEARRRGYRVRLWSTSVEGEARKVGPSFSSHALEWAPDAAAIGVVAGGETTVRVVGGGRGGRNQELVLSAAPAIEGRHAVLLSCGTDGIDGNTEAAGAIVDGDTLARARTLGLDPEDFLRENNSYAFFRALGDLIVTGPTGTNVADLLILLARRRDRRGRGPPSRSGRRPGTSKTRRNPRSRPPARRLRVHG